MSNSSFVDILRGYDKQDNDSTGTKFATIHITGHTSLQGMSKTAKRFNDFTSSVAEKLAMTSTRVYGLFLLIFGALTLFFHLVKDYINYYETLPIGTLIAGVAFALVGIPLVVFDKPIAFAMQDFRVTEFVFYEFFCLPIAHKRSSTVRGVSGGFAAFLAIVLSLIGAIVPLEYIIIFIVGAVYFYLTMLAPEFSLYLTFLVMPYLPSLQYGDAILAALVIGTTVSFYRKVSSGKRIFYFERYDLTLFLLLLFVLISGIFVKGLESFTGSLILVVLGMGYCLTSSLVTNRRLADGVIKAIIVSSIPVSVIAIAEAVSAIIKGGVLSFSGVSATFISPDNLGMFLLVSAACSVYFIIARRQASTKTTYGLIFVLTLVAMIATMRPWLIVATVFGLVAYAAQAMPHGSGVVLGQLSLLPYSILLLPSEWLMELENMPLLSELGFGESVAIWINSRKMLLDNLFIGVGIGGESFSLEYSNYTYSDVLPTSSGNFLLQIACEAGIFALIMFISIYGIRLKHRSIYAPYVSNSQMQDISRVVSSVTVALMVYGFFNSFWSDMTMYYLFFTVFGLGSATLRVAKSEFDDRVAYFSDGAGDDASSIDITIRR